MLAAYFCCIVLLLLLLLLKVSEPCTEEGLISGTRYRVQNQFFRASTQDSSYPATSARLDSTSWCSLSTDSLLRPYLEITFGTAVNISSLRIGGLAETIFHDAHFVTKFRVLVDSTGGSLSPIVSSGNLLDFNRSAAEVGNIQLPFFVTTQVLRIEAVEWSPAHPSQVCMKLEAYGCLAVKPVCESTSLLTNSALMDSVSASPSVPSSGLNMLVDGGSEEWCTDEEINGTFYFQLQFVCPVSLAYMQVKGFEQEEEIGFQTGYVRKFTLEVGDGSGDFTTYNITNTLAFRVPGPYLETMTFWRPVSGSIFRLNVLKYIRTVYFNVFCWKIMLYGCASPIAPAATEMDSSTGVPGSVLSPQQSQRRAIVGGAVGGVLGFFIIAALAVLMAVIVCIFVSKRKRGSVLSSTLLRARQIPTQINSSNINGIPSGSANGAANRSNAVLYENCGRFYPSSKWSTFTDSMKPRSTGTTDIEQSTKCVDSMVDSPTYCVPFPVDNHAVAIYPQKKPHPSVFPMISLTKGVSSIDMVDNECYGVPSSLSGRDDMEQSLVAGQQFPTLEYETPK